MSGKRGAAQPRGFMDGYKHYDPAADGYGDPHQWRGAFHQRMTGEEAREELKQDKPWDILNVPRGAPWAAIKKAYRRACLEWHPDLSQNHGRLAEAEAKMKKINAAFVLLEDEYGES